MLSDCNSVFISHILTGARLNTLVRHVITNQASFQRVAPPPPASAAADDGDGGGGAVVEPAVPAAAARPPRVPSGFGSGWLFRSSSGSGLSSSTSAGAGKPPAAPAVAHRLVIEPRHDHRACGSHGCSLCPANLCKVRPPAGAQVPMRSGFLPAAAALHAHLLLLVVAVVVVRALAGSHADARRPRPSAAIAAGR